MTNSDDTIPGMITTVITSFNKGKYLSQAIESALDQDYDRHEVLVIDDGSTDDTREIALNFGDRLRLISQENRGQCNAKNRGILEARGEFVAFLDGDDFWRPGKLRKQIELFDGQPQIGVVYTDRLKFRDNEVVWASNRVAHDFHRGWVLDKILVDNFVPFSSSLSRKAALLEVGMLDEEVPIAPDYDLWLRMARKYQFDYVDEILLEYRLASGSIGDIVKCKVEHTMRIQNQFILRFFNGRYPNQRAVREATQRKYVALGNFYLSQYRNFSALGAYLLALKNRPTCTRTYINLGRALLPYRIAQGLKFVLPQRLRAEPNKL